MDTSIQQKMRLRSLVYVAVVLCLFACESNKEGGASRGEVSGGEVSGGEVSGGEVSGGEVSGGEVSGGEVSGGEVSGGEGSRDEVPMCTDASQCPVPPPVALVECEDNWVVDVVFTPVCVEGMCDMDRSTRPQRDCSEEERICSAGECLTPPPALECNRDMPCADGMICIYQEGLCGAVGFSEGQGVCQPLPTDCDNLSEMPVCACDGQRYSSFCSAQSTGSDVSRFGGCITSENSVEFVCGDQSCIRQSYCSISINDVAEDGQLEFFAECVEIPELCQGDGMPTCETCFMPDSLSTCVDVGEQMIIVYPGG